MLELLLINSNVRYFDSELFTDDVELIHIIFDIVGNGTDIIFELAIIKYSQLLIYFIFETVEINCISFFFEMLFVGLEKLLFEVWGYLKFLEFGHS